VGNVMGGQGTGGMEAIGAVKLFVNCIKEMSYAFLFSCHVVGGFFFLFFGEEECLPFCKPLHLCQGHFGVGLERLLS